MNGFKKPPHSNKAPAITRIEKLPSQFQEEKLCNAAILKRKLKSLSHQWRNGLLRTLLTVVLIAYFCLTVYVGPILILLSTLVIQVQCFSEVIRIAYDVNKMPSLPWFRSISWYFLICANYFTYGESLADYFNVFFEGVRLFGPMIRYHRFISFCLYFGGVVWFVLSLGRKYDVERYSLLAWTHFVLAIIVLQSYMIVGNIFQGLIWLVVPVTMVVCNDIAAYVCGFFFGKTPLIKLSPKKTWEGYIGGGISTIIYGCLVSHFLCQQKYFVCPIDYVKNGTTIVMTTDCTPDVIFQPNTYPFEITLGDLLHLKGALTLFPFLLHSLALSFFSSFIGPFGGFFASGLKRACKIKDFGGILPGHGGIMDRFDCQYLMATFVNVYISSFVRTTSPTKIYTKWTYMATDQQLEFFRLLEESLSDRNLTAFL